MLKFQQIKSTGLFDLKEKRKRYAFSLHAVNN